MNIEEFREYCLSLNGVYEKMPFTNVPDKYSRDVLCFYVGSKWFCFVNIEVFDFCCIKYWISVYFNQDVPDNKIKELIKQSYDIVYQSLPKKEKGM